MRNLTPHPITIRTGSVDTTLLPDPAGAARVTTTARPLGAEMVPDGRAVPTVTVDYGDIVGLPADDEPIIVSTIVLEAVRRLQPWRRRAYAPDTGPDSAIRDAVGQIVAVRRLIGLPGEGETR